MMQATRVSLMYQSSSNDTTRVRVASPSAPTTVPPKQNTHLKCVVGARHEVEEEALGDRPDLGALSRSEVGEHDVADQVAC